MFYFTGNTAEDMIPLEFEGFENYTIPLELYKSKINYILPQAGDCD